MNEHTDNFYKDKAWELLQSDIRDIKSMQTAQAKDLQDIKSKINYIYGFAAAVSVVGSVAISYLRSWFMKSK